jgi:catechol 2,3-dioxygenase-like lactoylglutathione lyase family enzyme
MRNLLAIIAMGSALVALPARAADAPELGHWMVAISVADLDAETAFFQKFGFKLELDTTFGPQIQVRWLVSGNERIELLKIPNSQPGPVKAKPPGHAAIRGISQVTLSTTDIEATKAALVAQGLTPALDITEVAPLGIKAMYFQDPEGNAVEIAQKVG